MSAIASALSNPELIEPEDKFYTASQWSLIWWRFKKHKLGMISSILLVLLYLSAVFADFVGPFAPLVRFESQQQSPPSRIRIYKAGEGWQWPFLYATKRELDPKTFRYIFIEDETKSFPIRLLVKGDPYKLLGLISADTHAFGAGRGNPGVYLFGTDLLGRDVFSRTLHGARLSLTIPLITVSLSFVLGVILGGISGYIGGQLDNLIQRFIEILLAIPNIPLWIGLSAALPREWSTEKTFFAIALMLSVLGWTGLARVVRGKVLQLREEEYTLAAQCAGATQWRIVVKHLLPGMTSHLIVSVTSSIPLAIIGETSLSFFKIGMQPPAYSWGVLLQDSQNLVAIAHLPWLLTPALFVVATGLLFSFVGDGLRDAADPYTR